MKRYKLIACSLLLGLTTLSLNACTEGASSPSVAFAEAPKEAEDSGGLASLLTGSVVSSEEAQLRDTLRREIVLDFPIRIGVLFFQFDSLLDEPDRENLFDDLKNNLEATDLVNEAIQIPSSLVNSGANLEQLRQMAARFQTDILVLINATHSFERSSEQNLSFWDSFSEKAYYESKVKYEAIALDVYTGTLLSPFDSAVSGEPVLLDFLESNLVQQRYAYQKSVEEEAWKMLQEEAQKRLSNLAQDVEARKATLANQAESAPGSETENAEENNNA